MLLIKQFAFSAEGMGQPAVFYIFQRVDKLIIISPYQYKPEICEQLLGYEVAHVDGLAQFREVIGHEIDNRAGLAVIAVCYAE